MEPQFFITPESFRKWLEKNAEKEKEIIVGFYKKAPENPIWIGLKLWIRPCVLVGSTA